MPDLRSCTLLTMPTSGTGSLWRLLTAIAGPDMHAIKIAERYEGEGRAAELPNWRPEPTGYIYLYNTPHIVNPCFADPATRLITNFRDPRDLACNQFHWTQSHPLLNRTAEEIAAHRRAAWEAGIDAYVTRHDNTPLFRALHAVAARVRAPGPDTLNLSYAQLCLDFDALVDRMIAFLDVAREALPWDRIEAERTTNLQKNRQWIGRAWPGADICPGRFLRELRLETIRKLDERYASHLAFLRTLEAPALRPLLLPTAEREAEAGVALGGGGHWFITRDAEDTVAQMAGDVGLAPSQAYRIALAHRARAIFGEEVGGFAYAHAIAPAKPVACRALLPPSLAFEARGARPVRRYLASPAARIWRPFYDEEILDPACYLPTDTHWNHAGAVRYLGAFLRAALPGAAARLAGLNMRHFASTRPGDLGRRLALPPDAMEVVAPEQPQARQVFSNGIGGGGAVRVWRNAAVADGERALILHDSFAMWLINTLAEIFAETIFVHATIFDHALVESLRPDVVICLQGEASFPRPPEDGGDVLAFIGKQERARGGADVFAGWVKGKQSFFEKKDQKTFIP